MAGPQKVILDVDTGTDDAVALMLAALHPALDLVGATTVNGNVPVDMTTENTLRVFDHIGRSVPVHRGMAAPLVRPDFPVPRDTPVPGTTRVHGETCCMRTTSIGVGGPGISMSSTATSGWSRAACASARAALAG